MAELRTSLMFLPNTIALNSHTIKLRSLQPLDPVCWFSMCRWEQDRMMSTWPEASTTKRTPTSTRATFVITIGGFKYSKYVTNPDCRAFTVASLRRTSLSCSKLPFLLRGKLYTALTNTPFRRLVLSYRWLNFTYSNHTTSNNAICHTADNEENQTSPCYKQLLLAQNVIPKIMKFSYTSMDHFQIKQKRQTYLFYKCFPPFRNSEKDHI